MPPTPPNLFLFFGRMHPLLVHLPIGFLILLGVIEITDRMRRFKGVGQAREVILIVTALSAIVTITFGLMLSSAGGYDTSLLFWHKWMGITLGCGVLACCYAVWAKKPRLYGGLLLFTLLILVPASHFGGSMTHGKNYLTAYAPIWLRPGANQPVQAVAIQKPIADAASARMYRDLVQPVLEQNCVACHSADKSSGDLRLDSFAMIVRGGHSGPAFVAKNSAGSLMIQRTGLPAADPHHMPPDGKPQPGDDQLQLLQWWIDSGAPQLKTIADLNPSDDQLQLVSRLLKLPAPVEAGAVAPVARVDLQPKVDELSANLGIVVTPVAVDQPWVIVNAAVSRSFGDAELAAMSPLDANVVDLDLASTHITDAGLTSVGKMANLKRLRLDRTAITDAGLAQLKHLKKLEYLNLYGTAVTDAGLQTLAGLPVLRHLYLWKTKVDPTAAAAFVASKTDRRKIAQIQKQIEKLQSEIAGQRIEVVQGVKAATQPATKP
jgi:uncharacterized membrane protein